MTAVGAALLALFTVVFSVIFRAVFTVEIEEFWNGTVQPYLAEHGWAWVAVMLEHVPTFWGGFIAALLMFFVIDRMWQWLGLLPGKANPQGNLIPSSSHAGAASPSKFEEQVSRSMPDGPLSMAEKDAFLAELFSISQFFSDELAEAHAHMTTVYRAMDGQDYDIENLRNECQAAISALDEAKCKIETLYNKSRFRKTMFFLFQNNPSIKIIYCQTVCKNYIHALNFISNKSVEKEIWRWILYPKALSLHSAGAELYDQKNEIEGKIAAIKVQFG